MNNWFINLEYLSPSGLIGFWVLFIGLIFTGLIFYLDFFRLSENDDSFKDWERKNLSRNRQKEEIAILYPKETNFNNY